VDKIGFKQLAGGVEDSEGRLDEEFAAQEELAIKGVFGRVM